jgi:dTDP-4-dehydrorhamnose 3,5-epimerase
MTIENSKVISDLKTISPQVFYDFRGEYVETFRKSTHDFTDREGNKVEFVEDDISMSNYSVLRGLHGDDKTWKLIQCLYGEIYIVVVDMRKDSPTYLNTESFAVNEKNRQQILVPAGCVNGHLCLSSKCIFSYKQSQYYSGAGNQFTVRWDDPKLSIFWPIKTPLVSVRDSSAAFLK